MRIVKLDITRNPSKNYGDVSWSEIAPTLLSTDYKSPPLVKEEYEYRQDNN